MTKYIAFINVPGYLPEGDTPVFDTPGEAWSYLVDERRRGEDDAYEPGDDEGYSEVVAELEKRAAEAVPEPGTIYGDNPSYRGEHGLGLAYGVGPVSEAEAADILALQD